MLHDESDTYLMTQDSANRQEMVTNYHMNYAYFKRNLGPKTIGRAILASYQSSFVSVVNERTS